MKIFYASSIRGVHSKEKSFYDEKIIEHLLHHGVVYGAFMINGFFNPMINKDLSDQQIHNQQMNWLYEADIMVAEVSNPSLGVGYMIGRALEYGKKVLCLFRPSNQNLSAMIRGSNEVKCVDYHNLEEAGNILDAYLRNIEIEVNRTNSIAEVSRKAFNDLITGKAH